MFSRRSTLTITGLFIVLMLTLGMASTTLAASVSINGFLEAGNLVDNYYIHVNAGETISLRMWTSDATGNYVDTMIGVSGPNGFSAVADDNGKLPIYTDTDLAFTAPVSGLYIIQASSYPVLFYGAPSYYSGPYLLVIEGNFDFGAFTDDRENGDANLDGAAPVAIYCRSEGIEIWTINSESQGEYAFTVSKDRIDEVGDEPEENTLLAEGAGARVYRLTTGEFQVNAVDSAGKEYVHIWDGC